MSVKGSLKKCYKFWERLAPQPWILGVIANGYALPINENCTVPVRHVRNNKSACEHSAFVENGIARLVATGSVRQTTAMPHVISPLSVATNSSKPRLILDLSWLNTHLGTCSIKYDALDSIVGLLPKDGFLGKFDMKSGYHHVDILVNHQTYLGFSWDFGQGPKYFCFTVLPFGLSLGPFLFTKLFRPLVRRWRAQGILCSLYLDDGIFAAATLATARRCSQIIHSDLTEAGVVLADPKCVWEPRPAVDWLGFDIDLHRYKLKVVDRRVASALDQAHCLLNNARPTVRNRLQMTGKLISMSAVLGPIVQLKTRRLYESINVWQPSYNKRLPLSEGEWLELQFWRDNLAAFNGKSLSIAPGATRLVSTDASATAAGAVFYDHSGNKHVATASFNPFEASESSTYRELKTVLFALQSFSTFIRDQRVKVQTDNKGVVAIINKGSPKPSLQELAEQIYTLSRRDRCTVEPIWVPRDQNAEADEASRIVDFDDWGVRPTFFLLSEQRWGPHTIDRFADHRNAKLPRFNSKYYVPGTEAVDAFACNWKGDMNWLCPPIAMIARTILHLQDCQARGTLAIPEWRSQPYFHLLASDEVNFNGCVKDFLRFPVGTLLFNRASQSASVFNNQFCQSPFLLLLLDFTDDSSPTSPHGL